MKLKAFLIVIFFMVTTSATASKADIGVADKHVVMLQSGLDTIWGTYMFGIRNDTKNNTMFRASVMLPKEMIDFQAQDGITPEDIKTDTNGGLYVEKEFPPGLTLIAIGFKADASFGSGDLTFVPKSDLVEFSAMTKKGDLGIDSDQLASSNDAGMNPDKYNVKMSQGVISVGTPVKISLSGVPQGRSGLWIIGSLIGALLIALSTLFTFRTNKETALAAS